MKKLVAKSTRKSIKHVFRALFILNIVREGKSRKLEHFTHDILHWAEKKIVWRAKSCIYIWSIYRSIVRYSLYAGKASLQLQHSQKNFQFRNWARIPLQLVRSPGFRALLSRSSSSSAASTADFARFPVRVVDGSSKSILCIDKESEKSVRIRELP